MAHPSLEWMFRNRRTGQITIAQFPNLALGTFLVTVVVDRVVASGTGPHTVSSWTGAAALTWWSLDEVIRGVNPWRRLVGLAGCALVVADVTRLAR